MSVFTPRPDEGTPDVAWLLGGDRSDAHLYTAGERLPVGVQALPGRLPNDVVLWVESGRAVIAGDTLVDFGQGLEIPVEWLPAGVTREAGGRGLAPATRAAGRGRTRDARWADRQDSPRARARLTNDPFARQLTIWSAGADTLCVVRANILNPPTPSRGKPRVSPFRIPLPPAAPGAGSVWVAPSAGTARRPEGRGPWLGRGAKSGGYARPDRTTRSWSR